jgi:Carboxypeptidase regulatory-like domain
MSTRTTVLFALLSVFVSIEGYAQATGSIAGTVTDPSGALVSNAKVTITDQATGFSQSATASQEGTYFIPSVQPGAYTLTVEAPGFRRHVQLGVTLLANQSLTVNVRMEIGQESQKVEVSAQGEMIDTQTGTLGQVIEEKPIVDLPLNGRNAMQLTTLVAGTIAASETGAVHQSTFPATVTISSDGSRTNQISYNLDGVPQTDSFTNVNLPFPFPDVLKEFSVQTSNYGAQSGTNSGAVVNAVTKSGTNQLHGDAFEFLRNEVFNARNAFSSVRDPLKRNQFGFTVGGPVVLPHLYNGQNRTFFFGGYQGTRFNATSTTSTAYVPTVANLNGDFSALLNANDPNNPLGRAVQIVNPYTQVPYPGNQIPVSSFDPTSVQLLKKIPQGQGNGFIQYAVPSTQQFDEFTIRVDQNIRQGDRIYFRYFSDAYLADAYVNPQNILAISDGTINNVKSTAFGFVHTFTPALVNDFRFGVNRRYFQTTNPQTFTPKDVGVNISLAEAPFNKFLQFLAYGYFQSVVSPDSIFPTWDFTWADDLTLVHGRNTFAVGGSIQRTHFDQDAGDSSGSWDFSDDLTNYALASVVLGFMSDWYQSGPAVTQQRNSFLGLYVQDSFRATRQLTLTAGIRWDPGLVPHELNGQFVGFDQQAYSQGKTSQRFVNAPPGLEYPGDPGVLQNIAKDDWNNIAPRFGFAWDLFGNGKTVVRGGGGLFYNQRIGTIALAAAGRTQPFSPNVALNEPNIGPASDPYRGTGVALTYPLAPPSKDVNFLLPMGIRAFQPGVTLTTPRTANFNLTIERALSVDWLARMSYVGALSRHLNHTLELDNTVYIPGSPLGTAQPRFSPQYVSIGENAEEGTASYNSLQASLEKRVTTNSSILRGMSLMANYTFSKKMDTDAPGANVGQVSGGGNSMPVTDPRRVRFDTGLSGYDVKHHFIGSFVWNLPGLENSNGLVRTTLGNWELSGIYNIQSGSALTLMAGANQSQTALGRDRVDYLGGNLYARHSCGIHCVSYLNQAAFALPAIGTFGNSSKGMVRTPGSWNVDASILKNFSIHERYSVQLRGDFFNFFNHANLNPPHSNYSGGGFGDITSVSNPRIIQLAVKVVF